MDTYLEGRDRSRYAAATESLLIGSARLRHVFKQTPIRLAPPRAPLIHPADPEASVILIRNGLAIRFCCLPDGRRTILRILIPGDFAGLDNIVLSHPAEEIAAVCRVDYHALRTAELRSLMADRDIALTVLALSAEARLAGDRLAASIGRLDAEARLCALLLDIHDRLQCQRLISCARFNLPLTQEQIADHLGLTLVHVNRTLRRLREKRIVLFERGVVIILDMDRMRGFSNALPRFGDLPPADASSAASNTPQPAI
jgi:CRP/FNR family transcriptional regulator